MVEAARSKFFVGIGGWTFEPWRDNFYPKDLPQKRELEYASRHLTSIEINGTYYGSQKPESFARWREETPEDFVFALKGPRFATNRRKLAEAGESVERFISSGITELKDKLGPINWQFLPTKQFDADDFSAFLKLLPKRHDGHALRHVVEVRHESFRVSQFIALLREHGVAVALTDKSDFPNIHDITAPFVYARLQRSEEKLKSGYAPNALEAWAKRAREWAEGKSPADLELLAGKPHAAKHRDVFIYMIDGHKPKAPFAAMALLKELGWKPIK
jgi:uncharacterized protein YecE (DUF72 family)